MITRILCPLDLSDFSKRAFEHALALGRWYRAQVVALHVFAGWMPRDEESTYPAWMRHVPQAREEIDRELRELLRPAEAQGIQAPLVIREGDPVTEILAQASEMNADLIVLSTHGRSGFDRMVLGSVTEKVLRKASSPVLVVPPQAGDASEPFAGYHRVICAVDFSDVSRSTLDYAVSIAEQASAATTVVHVVEGARGTEEAGYGRAVTEVQRAEVEGVERQLRDFVQTHEGTGRALTRIVRRGTPHREILRLAAEIGADLVVLGVSGRGAIDLTLFGSTANEVVRRAPCAVLTVRSA
jgi:nucleotide-binding universal stress UspA family protein